MAAAMQWVSRIFAVTVEIVGLGLLGHWLDDRWGTSFLALVGFGLGISLGIWHLIVMTKRPLPSQKSDADRIDRDR